MIRFDAIKAFGVFELEYDWMVDLSRIITMQDLNMAGWLT